MKEPSKLPTGWCSRDSGQGVDLRVSSLSARKYVAFAFAMLAVLAIWKTISEGGTAKAQVAPWIGLTLVLALLAVWCAFGDEVWHAETNCLNHSIGIGGLFLTRRFQDAELCIILRLSTNFNRPYYRLYAVSDGQQHFLIERNRSELYELAQFLSLHTGWNIRSDESV